MNEIEKKRASYRRYYQMSFREKPCRTCGKIFLGNKNKWWCSNVCVKKYPHTNISGYRKCLYCPNTFPYRDSLLVRSVNGVMARKTKFCSVNCALQWRNKIFFPSTMTEEKRKMKSEIAKRTFTGYKCSLESRLRKSENNKGEKSHFWLGGITEENKKIRHSLEYRLWRETVFKRDDFTCQVCFRRGGRLHADHIKSFANYPELRFVLDNGRTLCEPCHWKTDNYGWKSNRAIIKKL